MIGVLVRLRLRLAWNRVTRGPHRTRQMLSAAFTVVFSVGFVVLAGLNTASLLNGVARTDRAAAILGIPMLLLGVTVLTLFTSLSSAFHHLFLAGDLELLMVAPVPYWSLFGLKTLEIWRDSVHIILFEGAALLGFGLSLGLPPSYYVAACLVGLLLTLGASAAGATISLALARIRFGEPILGLSRLLAIVLFLPVGVLGVPSFGFGRGRISLLLNPRGINAVTDQLRSIGEPPEWAPTTWAAHILLVDDQAALSLALLLATAAILLVGMQRAFAGMYQSGWERVRFSPAVRPSARQRLRLPLPALPRSPIAGIVLKDWRSVIRDPRWRTGTLVSLVALGLPAMVLFAGDPFARSAHVMRFWFGMVPVPYLAFLIGSQQGASTLSYEGRNVGLLRAAPVGMARVLAAKLVGGLVLVLVVTWTATLTLGISHAGEPLEIAGALLAATWLGVGATLAAVASAGLTIDFESDNPQRRVGCLGTIVTAALSVCFFVTNTGALVWWVLRSLFNPPRLVLALAPIVDWGLPLLALASVAAILIAARLAVQRLAAWEPS